jgi:hypothetical protein
MTLTKVVSILVGLLLFHTTIASGTDGPSTSGQAAKPWPPQVQVAAWVPFEPTAFQSEGRQYLVYEPCRGSQLSETRSGRLRIIRSAILPQAKPQYCISL